MRILKFKDLGEQIDGFYTSSFLLEDGRDVICNTSKKELIRLIEKYPNSFFSMQELRLNNEMACLGRFGVSKKDLHEFLMNAMFN